MKPPLSHIPLLPVFAALVAGILFERAVAETAWCYVPAVAAVVMWIAGRRSAALYVAVVAAGWLLGITARPQCMAASEFSENCRYGAVVLDVSESESARSAIVEIDSAGCGRMAVPVRCYLRIYSMLPVMSAGDRVRFNARFDSCDDSCDLPDEPSMAAYYYRQRISVTAVALHDSIAVSGHEEGILWDIRRLRSKVNGLIASVSVSSGAMDMLAAVLTGDDSMLSPDVRMEFSSAGVAHVLALSGLHVAILAYVIAVALLPLTLCGLHRWRWGITILLLWGYAVMTGLSPSVTRAVVMSTMVLAGYMFQRRNSSFNSLCLAAIVILIFSPRSLYSIGFQLTFMAVAAIIAVDKAAGIPYIRCMLLRMIVEWVVVAVAAVIGTGILSAYYFHQFPLYFIVANIPVTVLLPFFVVAGVALVASASVGLDPQWLCSVADSLYDAIDSITGFTASLPGATVNGLYFSGWMLIAVYFTIALSLAALYYRHRRLWIGAGCMACVSVIIASLCSDKFPHSEMYIPRTAYSTQVIVKEGSRLYLMTTAAEADRNDVIMAAAGRYAAYMGRRGIDTLTVMDDTLSTPAVYRRGRQLVAGDNYFIIVNSNEDVRPSAVKPRYALVCRGFKGDIADVVSEIDPDTILLSRDIDVRRCRRYTDALASSGIPYRSLRDKPFKLIIYD